METKLNKIIHLVNIFMISSAISWSQKNNYSTIVVDNIDINGFKYDYDINKCKEIFGKPKVYKEYVDPYPIEGYGKNFYLIYDSIKFTFVEFYNNVILSNINIHGEDYTVNTGNFTFKVGDKLEKLKYFEKSYAYFLKQNPKPYKEHEHFFYINLLIKRIDYEYYGIINIKLINDTIKEVSFRFDDGT